MFLKYRWKDIATRVIKQILKKKKVGGLQPADFKICYKAIVISVILAKG